MDLSVLGGQNIPGGRRDRKVCICCGSRGHWSASYGTKPGWGVGNPVSGYCSQGGPGRRSARFQNRRAVNKRGAFHVVEGSSEFVEPGDLDESTNLDLGVGTSRSSGYNSFAKNWIGLRQSAAWSKEGY